MVKRWSTPGDGFERRPGGLKRIVVSFDQETFAQIRSIATAEGHSFAEQVRELVEFGLEDIAEQEVADHG